MKPSFLLAAALALGVAACGQDKPAPPAPKAETKAPAAAPAAAPMPAAAPAAPPASSGQDAKAAEPAKK